MQLPEIVLKFGGTSLTNATAIRAAGDIVRQQPASRVAVVVSAAAGVTDDLLTLAGDAAEARADSEARLISVQRRHAALLTDLQLSPQLLADVMQELADLTHGVSLVRECTSRTRDRLLSYGEIFLSRIFAAHLESRGTRARAWDAGALGLITDDRFGRARPLPEAYERIAVQLTEQQDHVPVITGFIGCTALGERTTLGRGGSDYSASIVARACRARELQIWTDVDGIMTADPRLVPGARLIERLSFPEASELAFSGAKVLHPSTITPAMEGGIPVRVLNTACPGGSGTTIEGQLEDEGQPTVRSIAHKPSVRVVTVVSPRMLDRHGFVARIAAVFDRHRVSVDMISTSEVSISFTTDATAGEIQPAATELEEFSQVTVHERLGQVSVVGAGLGKQSSAVSDLLATVSAAGAEIEMVSYGVTRLNLSVLIPESAISATVTALHERCFAP